MKTKVAFIGLTSCKGCFFEFLLIGKKLETILDNIEIVNFRMLKDFKKKGNYDITFMDGAVSTKNQIKILRDVRKRTKFLIAFGTCACSGGIPMIRNSVKNYRKTVYDKEVRRNSLDTVTPLNSHVKVDYYMRGCPINENEVIEVSMDLIAGKKPREKDYCVCVECKKNGTKCLFKEGKVCYGPVTYAGCNAPCPSVGTPCDGCRGPLPDGNRGAEIDLLKERGISEDDIKTVLSRYSGEVKK